MSIMSLGCGDKRVNVMGQATVDMVMTLSVLYGVFWVSGISLAIKAKTEKFRTTENRASQVNSLKPFRNSSFTVGEGEGAKSMLWKASLDSWLLEAYHWVEEERTVGGKKKKAQDFEAGTLLFGVPEQNWGLSLGKNVIILGKGDKNRRL